MLSRLKSDDGGALIAVVWAVLLLSLIAVGVMGLTLKSKQSAKFQTAYTQDIMTVRSAVELFFRQNFYNSSQQAYLHGRVDVGGETVELNLEFEQGKLDLNRASIPLLGAFFLWQGLSEQEAHELAATIGDWRDSNGLMQTGGAEADSYLPTGLPRNGAFEAIGELKAVKGINEQIYSCALPFLTAASPIDYIDAAFASDEMREFLEWAYLNVEDNVINIDPRSVPKAGAYLDEVVSLGGQTITISASILGQPKRNYQLQVRFKSISDMSFALLKAVKPSYDVTHRRCE